MNQIKSLIDDDEDPKDEDAASARFSAASWGPSCGNPPCYINPMTGIFYNILIFTRTSTSNIHIKF